MGCTGNRGKITVPSGRHCSGFRCRGPPLTLRVALGASPLLPRASAGCPDFCRLAPSRLTVYSPSFRLALRASVVRFATMAAADFSRPRSRLPFRARGEISPGNGTNLPRTTAGSTPPSLDRKSFAAICPLALEGSAWYPISVRRLAVSRFASFSDGLAAARLAICSKSLRSGSSEDLHLQVSAHVGHT